MTTKEAEQVLRKVAAWSLGVGMQKGDVAILDVDPALVAEAAEMAADCFSDLISGRAHIH